MKKYQHVFFDLDHTLWDFDKNSSETLEELFITYQLAEKLNTHSEKFIEVYLKINQKMWMLYNQNKVSKQELRDTRFKLLFKKFKYNNAELARTIDNEYINTCPKKGKLIEGALEVVEHLSNDHIIHVITNGFQETQETKIKYAGLEPYISELITSENSGYQKPHTGIFSFALDRIKSNRKECIMIGDNLETDIKGAKQSRMDHIFFNEMRIDRRKLRVQHEVFKLLEIKKILP